MSTPVLISAFWVLAATGIAFLPMRWQIVPGLFLLAAAPVLIFWLGYEHGWFWSVAGVLAFVSMFRRPLRHLMRRALGRSREAGE